MQRHTSRHTHTQREREMAEDHLRGNKIKLTQGTWERLHCRRRDSLSPS